MQQVRPPSYTTAGQLNKKLQITKKKPAAKPAATPAAPANETGGTV
jgi:hypothetical protein